MGKKYLDTKKHSVESSILSVWQEASLKQEKLDAVNKNAVKKKFDDRKDKDIDNDGDVDSSDKYLHKRRKAVSKAMKDEGNAFGKALRDAKEKGEKTFVVAGKTYDVKEEVKEYYEMGTDEYRKHTQGITPGQEIQDYGRLKMQSMKEALAKVWGLDESESSVKKEKKDLTKELKGGKTLTGKESDTVDVEPKLEKKK
jgi:hypothetical protein